MKHILVAALITIGLTSSAFAHERHRGHDRDRDHRWEHRHDRGHYRHQRHRRGERLNRHEYYRVVEYREYRHYHLQTPPRGYHYVRDRDGEILLVGIATGIIIGVILSQ